MTCGRKTATGFRLLVLNGVSSATGRRILTTVLASDYHPKATCPVAGAMKTDARYQGQRQRRSSKSAVSGPIRNAPFFWKAFAFMICWRTTTRPTACRIQRLAVWDYVRNKLPFLTPRNLDDIRLSTAAHNSARFPIVSPAGEIRNRQHQIVDRIVDGGYFENYGALGAMELAQAIRAIEPKLAPFVLVISNDPDEDPDLTKVDVADDAVLADISVPDRGRRQYADVAWPPCRRPARSGHGKCRRTRLWWWNGTCPRMAAISAERPTVILKMSPALSR